MDSKRKYKIKEYYDQLAYGDRMSAISHDCREMGISRSHFRKIWSYTTDDAGEAKPSQLMVIARRFGCKIEDLISEDVAAPASSEA